MSFGLNYLLGISINGIVLLSILSLMSFMDVEALKVGKKSYDSGRALAYSVIVL
jgi:hypothetical protein